MRPYRCLAAGTLLLVSLAALPAAAQAPSGDTPPPGGPQTPTVPAATGPAFPVHVEFPSRVGDEETDRESALEITRTVVGSLDAPLKVLGERKQLQAVYHSRVTRVDAKGDAVESRVSVRSASGRTSSQTALKSLTTAHSTLVVVRYPHVKITRTDGRPIPAGEIELWKLLFEQVTPDKPSAASYLKIPETAHVGDTFLGNLPPLAFGDGGFKADPDVKATTVVTGTQQIKGAQYLLLKTHVSSPLHPTEVQDKDLHVKGGRMEATLQLAAPTGPTRSLAHAKMDMMFTVEADGRATDSLTIPMTVTATSTRETTVVDFKPGS